MTARGPKCAPGLSSVERRPFALNKIARNGQDFASFEQAGGSRARRSRNLNYVFDRRSKLVVEGNWNVNFD
jgi:hypothetical protein